MSNHERYLVKDGDKFRLFRPKGRQYEVLRYSRYDYSNETMTHLCARIAGHLTMDLISWQVRRLYPEDHPKWRRELFGYCVPATFALLYFIDSDRLVPFRGHDDTGEGHWWLADRDTGERFDITGCQYTNAELAGVYATGRQRGYYGHGEAPAARFLKLMHRVQPDSQLFLAPTLE